MRILEVGLGTCGLFWAREMIPQVPDAELVGCVDLDPAALARARAALGMAGERCFASLELALQATDPDAVLVATTLEGHVPVARTALESGRHVLTEKPFAPTLAAAAELVELAAARRLVLMVSQNYRFFPAVRAAADLVRSGSLGALHEVHADFRRRSPVAPGAGGHRLLEQPLLVDMAIHHFDLMRLLVRDEADQVHCHAWNPSWSGFAGPPAAVATVLFPAGVVASYRGSWLGAGRDTAWAGEWRMSFEHGEAWWTSRAGMRDTGADRLVVRSGDGAREAELPAMPLVDRAGSLAEFMAAVHGGRAPESSGRENLGSLALTFAAVESARQGAPVAVARAGAPS